MATRWVRAVLDAGTGERYAALAAQEWEVRATHAQRVPQAGAADAQRCNAR